MSEMLSKAVAALNEKIAPGTFDATVKFVLEGEGSILLNEEGAAISDADADCVMTAEADVFEEIMDGSLGATQAFMSGKLSIDGDMSVAMKLAGII